MQIKFYSLFWNGSINLINIMKISETCPFWWPLPTEWKISLVTTNTYHDQEIENLSDAKLKNFFFQNGRHFERGHYVWRMTTAAAIMRGRKEESWWCQAHRKKSKQDWIELCITNLLDRVENLYCIYFRLRPYTFL